MNYQTVTDYLSSKSIPFKTSSDNNEAMICCPFCPEDTKFHLYVSNLEGCFDCKKCGTQGSWKEFVEKLGETSVPELAGSKYQAASQVEYTARLDTTIHLDSGLVAKCHAVLPDRIKNYLKTERDLTDETINKAEIGYDEKSKSIVYPVYDLDKNLIGFRHRRDPQKSDGPKYWSEKGSKATIFNIQVLESQKGKEGSYILITEGEFDSLLANQYGFPAVCGTGGAGTFKEEWVSLFDGIGNIYICLDTDEAGKRGAKHIATLFDHRAKIVELPSGDDEKVDVTDYFVKLKHTADDFQKLLDQAKPFTEDEVEDFEILSTLPKGTIHPALDFHDDQLFMTMSLPVRLDKKETIKPVTISSNRERGIVAEGKVSIGGKHYLIRKVTAVPNDHVRWAIEDIHKFFEGKEPISPTLVFIEIRQALLKFVDFHRSTDADILALWLMGGYVFPLFDAFPYIYLVGVKRSGKTKTLLLIERLAFNAILSSNVSPSVLFRLVEARRCTLALDEGELLAEKDKKEELKELLNSGYKRGAPAYRVKKNNKGEFEIETFEVYAPKAIANISGLDNVLEDRAIVITMVRTTDPTKGNVAVTENAENWSYLRSLLYQFAFNHAKQVADIYHQDPEVSALLNRQNELWRPLLSIAKVVDQELPGTFIAIRDEAIRRAEEVSGSDLEDLDSAVLFALRDLVKGEGNSVVTNKEIRDKGSEFLDIDQKQYFTSRMVGSALKRFGIRGKKVQGYWRYNIDEVVIDDLFGRYNLKSE